MMTWLFALLISISTPTSAQTTTGGKPGKGGGEGPSTEATIEKTIINSDYIIN